MNGLVLAGGQSTRMQQNKALINYHGLPQYQYIYNLLHAHCNQVFISTNTHNADIDLQQLIDSPIIQQSGPIAALHTAFAYQQTAWLVVAVDYPLIKKRDINLLVKSADKGQDASVYFNQQTNFYEPFLGIYYAAFQNQLVNALQNNNTSMQTVLQNSNVLKVLPKNNLVLTNVNTPAEMQQVLKFL